MTSETIYTTADRTPYTYLVKCIPEGTIYYGVRYAKYCNPNDLWNTYFTSSKYIKELIIKYGKDKFIVEIRKIFSDVKSAQIWEQKVLRRMDVINRVIFINKTNNISISPECCGHNKGKTGELCHRTGVKNPFLSNFNKQRTGERNHMFGRKGELAPGWGKRGELHHNFGKKNEKQIAINKIKLTCPHCNYTGCGIGNMSRWHFDNCKHKDK